MNGFKIGEHVKITSFMDKPVHDIEGIIVAFKEKSYPRDIEYKGNDYTHWVIVKITKTTDGQTFVVKLNEEWPAQFNEIKRVHNPKPSSNFHIEGDESQDL